MIAVFLDFATLHPEDLDISKLAHCFTSLETHAVTPKEEVITRLQHADVAISNKVILNEDIFRACPKLKLVLIAATGLNNIDLAAARQYGITVTNCQDYGSHSVAQHALMLLLNLATQFPQYAHFVRSGRWSNAKEFSPLHFPIRDLQGLTLGILGYGAIGKRLAEMAKALGMKILLGQVPGSNSEGRLALAEFLPQLDALSLHCPLTPQTQSMIGAKELASLKAGAFLINVARGKLIDEDALLQALRSGHLGGAGLDVLSKEPPPPTHPLLTADIPNLIITPHVAWGSQGARQTVIDQLAENVIAWQQHISLRVVN